MGGALLANHLAVLASAQWGARQRPALLQALGFREGTTPQQSTIQRLFRVLDPAALSVAMSRYFAAALPAPVQRGEQGVAIDGKAQRGRRAFATTPGGTVHALTAYSHDGGIVLAQQEIRSTADKVEAELTVAPALIAQLDWHGRVMTGDALFCQRQLCAQLRAAGGDYLLLVKENQPTLYHDLALLFDPPADGPQPLPLLDRREAVTLEKGHGRTHDQRHLLATTDLSQYLDWPGLAQVFRLERTWRARGQDKRAVHYGITSLPPAEADAARLLALKRGHWGIENGLHYCKDMAWGEDRCQIRLGAGPMILATLRDTALSLLHTTGCRNVAARLRHYGQYPSAAVALLRRPTSQNA
jgi:predicted transposase YbfD/YdcC